MAYSYDPQIASALAGGSKNAPPKRGDWKGLRHNFNGLLERCLKAHAGPGRGNVTTTRHEIVAADGASLEVRWYKNAELNPGSAVVYLHGGGMICGNLDIYDPLISSYVATTGVPMLAVEYRLAPEHPHPVPVEDSYAGLRWLIDNADKLGVNPARIAVMGDSAGGGLTAGVALLARDRGLALARQIMIYPMLDDRNTITDETLAPFAIWTYDYNFTGWNALLDKDLGTDNVSPSAAPSRAKNLTGVAPAYIEVGELDILRNEDIEYARRIACAGISMELHVHAGAPHAFDLIAPHSDLVKRCMADRARVLKAL